MKLAYSKTGNTGTPVVLIMGYTMPGSAWLNQIGPLSEHHQVVWFDNRGVGDSDAPPGAYTMGQMAGDVANLFDHLGLEDAHVVGVSMGGMIAQEFSLQYRHRVRSLALLATHSGGLRSILPSRQGIKVFLQARTRRSTNKLDTLMRLLYTEDYLTPEHLPEIERTLQAQFNKPLPTRNRLAQFAAILRHDTRLRLAQLSGLPTLVIKPSKDILVRPKGSERLARMIPGSEMIAIHAGHGVIRQCAPEVNQALLTHFKAADLKIGG